MAIDGHCRQDAAPPPLSALFKPDQSTCHTPFARIRAPTPPHTRTHAITVEKSRPPCHCRLPEILAVGEVLWTLSSCFFFAPNA
jgi:hypothetical protein